MQKGFIDCIVLPYKQKSYLFPAVAIVEIILSYAQRAQKIVGPGYLSSLPWRDFVLPVVPLDLNPLKEELTDIKIAIIHSLDVKNEDPPYVATLAEKHPRKIKIHPPDLLWSDSANKIARMKNAENKEEEYVLFDLTQFSGYIQKRK